MSAYLDWARPRLHVLQNAYLKHTWSRGILADLRYSFRQPVGSNPKAAKWSLNGMPGYHGYGSPTRLEKASWLAFSLYAYHQQGNHVDPMFEEGKRFHQALGELAQTGEDVEPLISKLVNARNMSELATHLLRIIRLFNQHHITCDHAMLALDMVRYDKPESRDMVRAEWSRNVRIIIR